MQTLTVKKGTALAELVEEGESFELAKLTPKTRKGLAQLNLPVKQAAKFARSPFVVHAVRWIAKLPSAS